MACSMQVRALVLHFCLLRVNSTEDKNSTNNDFDQVGQIKNHAQATRKQGA